MENLIAVCQAQSLRRVGLFPTPLPESAGHAFEGVAAGLVYVLQEPTPRGVDTTSPKGKPPY